MKFFYIGLFILFLCSCKYKKQQTLQAPKTDTTATKISPRVNCYEWKEKNSRAIAKLTIENDSVSGTLEYLFSEKDNSSGTLAGFVSGDTIFADFTFWAEGKQSVMEVIFLQQGDKLVQGHGPMMVYNGKLLYAQPNRLEFITAFKGKPCE